MTDRRVLQHRPSGLDLTMTCSESGGDAGDLIVIDEVGEPARMGQAFHRWAENMESPDDQPDINELAERFKVDCDELDLLCNLGKRFWHDHLKKWLHGGESEIEMEMEVAFPYNGYTHLNIRGKSDKIKVIGNRVYTNDWKTGRMETDCTHQQRAYAYLALARHPECDQVWSAVSYIRHNYFFAGEKILSRKDLDSWLDDLIWHLRNTISKYNPGSHCGWCQRMHDCPARDKWSQSALATFSKEVVISLDGSPLMVGPQLAKGLKLAKYVEDECKRFRAVAKQYAKDHGGEFPSDPDIGMKYQIKEKKIKTISPLKAWKILASHLTEEEMAPAVKITKGKIESALKAKAEPGEKGKYIKEVFEELTDAGAMEEITRQELKETR